MGLRRNNTIEIHGDEGPPLEICTSKAGIDINFDALSDEAVKRLIDRFIDYANKNPIAYARGKALQKVIDEQVNKLLRR